MIHFLDTEEGKSIARKNLGTVGIKGIAITALGYGKLDRRMKALKTGAQYYNYKIGEMDGKDMRSNRKMEIKELKKDDMEVNNEKNINKFGIFNYFNSLCIN